MFVSPCTIIARAAKKPDSFGFAPPDGGLGAGLGTTASTHLLTCQVLTARRLRSGTEAATEVGQEVWNPGAALVVRMVSILWPARSFRRNISYWYSTLRNAETRRISTPSFRAASCI